MATVQPVPGFAKAAASHPAPQMRLILLLIMGRLRS